MATIFKPPAPFALDARPSVFLAGSIEMVSTPPSGSVTRERPDGPSRLIVTRNSTRSEGPYRT